MGSEMCIRDSRCRRRSYRSRFGSTRCARRALLTTAVRACVTDRVCRYQGAPSGKWYPAKFEQSVVEHLVATQFETYCKKVQTSDCAAEMRRCVVSQS